MGVQQQPGLPPDGSTPEHHHVRSHSPSLECQRSFCAPLQRQRLPSRRRQISATPLRPRRRLLLEVKHRRWSPVYLQLRHHRRTCRSHRDHPHCPPQEQATEEVVAEGEAERRVQVRFRMAAQANEVAPTTRSNLICPLIHQPVPLCLRSIHTRLRQSVVPKAASLANTCLQHRPQTSLETRQLEVAHEFDPWDSQGVEEQPGVSQPCLCPALAGGAPRPDCRRSGSPVGSGPGRERLRRAR